MSTTAGLILVLIGLTSVAAFTAATLGLGRSPRDLRAAFVRVVEGAGLVTVFLALNLVLGFAIVRILAAVTDQFISAHVLQDVTLVLLSAIQGFAFYFWLERR